MSEQTHSWADEIAEILANAECMAHKGQKTDWVFTGRRCENFSGVQVGFGFQCRKCLEEDTRKASREADRAIKETEDKLARLQDLRQRLGVPS